MKLSELLLTGGSKGAPMSLPSSFDGFGGTAGHGAQGFGGTAGHGAQGFGGTAGHGAQGFGGTAGHGAQGQFADPTGAGGGQPIDGGEWWQDEAGHWHFGGPAEYWFRDEHHQWHKGGETQLWRQDETGNWHEVQEDHPKSSEDELMMAAGPHDMGAPDDDIKDLDALNKALKDEMPPMDPSFTPSIENIITQSGPNELGKNVAELSRSLGTLKDDVNSHLSQDRIAAMTAEDVPNMVTPVAASLKEVIQSAKSLKERLTAISDAAYSIVGTASEDVEERLEGDEPSANEELPEPHEADHGYEYGHGGPDDYAYGSGGYDDYTYGHGNPDDYSYGHHGGHGGTEMAVQGAQVPLLLWKAPTPAAERLAQRRRSFL